MTTITINDNITATINDRLADNLALELTLLNPSVIPCEEHKGYKPNLYRGFCIECLKNGKIGYSSICYAGGETLAMRAPYIWKDWNDLGRMAEDCILVDAIPTGRLLFMGYFVSDYWGEEFERVE